MNKDEINQKIKHILQEDFDLEIENLIGKISTELASLSLDEIIDDKTQKLTHKISDLASKNLAEDVQKELAELIKLIPYFRDVDNPYLVDMTDFAIDALIQEADYTQETNELNYKTRLSRIEHLKLAIFPSAGKKQRSRNVLLASKLRKDIQFAVSAYRTPVLAIVKGIGTPSTQLIAGLIWFFIIFAIFPFTMFVVAFVADTVTGGTVLLPLLQQSSLIMKLPIIFTVVPIGALGSVISVLLRSQSFVDVKRKQPLSLFFTGFFKPVVGMAFSIFVYSILRSEIISFGTSIKLENRNYLYIAIAFIAGFSERFVQDIVIRTEQTVAGSTSER
jgi:hypothetical protein